MNSKKISLIFLTILILLTSIIIVTSTFIEIPSFSVPYTDPSFGIRTLNLMYPLLVPAGQPVIISITALKSSEKNNFELYSSIKPNEKIPPEYYTYNDFQTSVGWKLIMKDVEEFKLVNSMGQITHFKVMLEGDVVETTIDSTYPTVVFQEKEFIIKSTQTTDNLRDLHLEPDCPVDIKKISNITWLYDFHCSINELTIFNLFRENEQIDEFKINTFNLDYCEPACADGEICIKNQCEYTIGDNTHYENLGDFCNGLDNLCTPGLICENGFCTLENILSGNFGELDDSCSFDMPCNSNSNLVCELGFCVQIVTPQPIMVGLDKNCDGNLFICKEDLICSSGFCVINDTNIISYGFEGADCDNQILFCQDYLECINGVCLSDTQAINTTNTTILNLTEIINIIETNVSIVIDENSTDLDNKLDNTFEDEKIKEEQIHNVFEDILTTKIKLPELVTNTLNPQKDEPNLRLEIKEERVFEITYQKELNTSVVELSKESNEQLTRILTREQLLKTNIKEQQEKANEKVRIVKKLVHETEQKSDLQNQEGAVSTKITITVEPIGNATSIDIIEVIPKELVASARDLIYNIQPIILEDDPIIMWHLENLNESVELSYRVEKNVSLTGNTILLSDDVELDFDWRTLLPLLFMPLIGGLVVGFSKFEDMKKKKEMLNK